MNDVLERSPVTLDEPLATTLDALGIQPFTRESVNKYMTRAQNKAKDNSDWWSLAMLVLAFIAMAVLATLSFILLFDASLWLRIGVFSAVWLVVGSVTVGVRTHDRNFVWEITAVGKYKRHIPARASELLASVRRICPETVGYVYHLTGTRDPFLYVQLGGESYFIDVWEETYFWSPLDESRRTRKTPELRR